MPNSPNVTRDCPPANTSCWPPPHRAAHPTSKAQLADWYHQTVLPRLLPATADQLSRQVFWNHRDRVTQADIEAVERALSQRLIEHLNLSLRTLVY